MRGIEPHRAGRSGRRRLAGFSFDLTPGRPILAAALDRPSVKRSGILFLAACLIVIWPGAGIAHWPASVDSSADAGTGYTSLAFDGEIHVGIEACEPEGSDSACGEYPVDQDEFPRLEVGTESVEVLSWINTVDEAGEPQRVGFMYEVTGGVAEITATSGPMHTDVPDEGLGIHSWVFDTCVNNGDGTAACDPDTTPLDAITICLTVETAGSCPAVPLASGALRNDGSVPLALELVLGEPLVSAPAEGFCEFHRLDISLAIGDPSDVVYIGDPCAVGALADFPLGVLDPGEDTGVHLTGELLPDFDPAYNGTTVEIGLRFAGTLWNTPAWSTIVTPTASITIGGVPPPAPDATTESTERVDPAPPVVSPPPAAEPPSDKPPEVEPPVKPPEEEPAPPVPPDEEPVPPVPPEDPDPVPPPEDPDPVPPPDDTPPEPPPVEPPPEEPPPVEPPPEQPPPSEEPPPPAEPAIGFVHLPGHDERIEGTAASSGRGDLTLVMLSRVAEWASGDEQILFSHWGNNVEDRSFLILLTPDGELQLNVYSDGWISYTTDPVTYEDGEWRWLQIELDVNKGGGQSTLAVSSSDQPESTEYIDVEWDDPDLTVTKNRSVNRKPAPGRAFKIGGHGTHAPTEMDVALVALMAEMQPGSTEIVFGSDWRADGAFTGNPPSRPDDVVPEIEWTLEGRDIEHVPSALAFVDWLPSVVLAAAPALSTATRRKTRRKPTENSAGKPGMAGIATRGEVMPGFLS